MDNADGIWALTRATRFQPVGTLAIAAKRSVSLKRALTIIRDREQARNRGFFGECRQMGFIEPPEEARCSSVLAMRHSDHISDLIASARQ
jgi:hypothetical protein